MAFFARHAEIRSDVVFRTITTNQGNGYNNTTGRFTAPLKGVYVFDIFYTIPASADLYFAIQVNGNTVCAAYAVENWDVGVCSAVVQLELGDVVNVKMTCCEGGSLWQPEYNSGFSGFLYLAL